MCAVSQTFAYAGREDVARSVHGAAAKLLKRDFGEVAYASDAQKVHAHTP